MFGSRYSAPSSLPAARVWTDLSGARFFLLPDAFDAGEGPFLLRTPIGNVRRVREDDVVAAEITREAAQAWLVQHLDPAVATLRDAADTLIDDLRRATEASRRENVVRAAEVGASWDLVRETVASLGTRLGAEWRRAWTSTEEPPATPTVDELADRVQHLGDAAAEALRAHAKRSDGADDAT